MIETERLLLRQFREGDAADVLEYLKTPAVNCFACMKLQSLDAAKQEIRKRAEDELYLAIVLKETGKVIGEIFAHPEGIWITADTATPMKRRMPISIICSMRKAQGASTPIRRTTISAASGCVSGWECGGKDCSWSS